MEEKKENSKLGEIVRWIILLVVVVLIALGLRRFVIEPYNIPSGSMIDTIEIGDIVMAQKVTLELGKEPEAGQIVTFYNVEGEVDDKGKTIVYIKRVIATAGQTVDLRDGYVYIDGEKQEESYTDGQPSYDLNSGIEYPFTVSEGCIWVMGDNRTNSSDSRWFGEVPIENVNGIALFRYWPLNRIGGLDKYA